MEADLEQQNLGFSQVELGDSFFKVRARGKFLDKDARDFVPTPESALLLIDTPMYDGPLDLLLHLIRKHSMDIFDIPIAHITQKYLEALGEMNALNLDVAGEFLVMAATLTEIKSKMLLPKEQQHITEDTEEEGDDPRLELVKRLLAYKSFKEASNTLLARDCIGKDMFFRQEGPKEQALEPQGEQSIVPFGVFELVEKLVLTLKKSEQHNVHFVTRDRISVSARIREMMEYCHIRSKFSFMDVLRFFPIYEKVDVIVSFLAILEMSRLKLVKVSMSAVKELLVTVNKENFYSKQEEILLNLDDKKSQDSDER